MPLGSADTNDSPGILGQDHQRADAPANPQQFLSNRRRDSVWVADPHSFAILDANRAATELLGYSREAFLSLTLSDFMNDSVDAAAEFSPRLRKGLSEQAVRRALRKKDGGVSFVQLSSRVSKWKARRVLVVSAQEIPSDPPREDPLQPRQNMEAIALLAGGILHDFNNTLTAILGFAELLQKKMDATDPRKRIANEIVSAAVQGRNLTAQLVGFSRKATQAVSASNVGAVLDNTEPFISRLIRADLTLTITIDGNVGSVEVRPSQVFQILLNLILNAQDAAPAGGHIAVTLQNADILHPQAYLNRMVPPGPYVELRVSDTGHGMDAATVAKLFTPFFTTKGPAGGTGLGLYTVCRIVRENGGFIGVESSLRVGTTFGILLPRVNDRTAPDRVLEPHKRTTSRDSMILVVNANQRILRMVCAVLEEHGLRVVGAGSAGEAVHQFRKYKSEIDLLLSDVVMPEMNGVSLARRFTRTRPELKVLFITAHEGERKLISAARATGAILEKPFECSELVAKVDEVLEAQGQA